MENNEICMCIDVKLDIYDKRPDSLRFKQWTRCQVKIQAVKCVPCFLRLYFQPVDEEEKTGKDDKSSVKSKVLVPGGHPNDSDFVRSLSVSINVPGVSISLASSRTKEHSYGLFWTQNRRNCFIYFALDTAESCRKHMKWLKKSIKNLELHRQIFLEQRRISRGPINAALSGPAKSTAAALSNAALKPLPKIPIDSFNGSTWSQRVSEIYEEIFEDGSFKPMPTIDDKHEQSPRPNGFSDPSSGLLLSRRISNASMASGIYEEMNLEVSLSNFGMVCEEAQAAALNLLKDSNTPPPPLPPPRKRLNTFQSDFCFSEMIPRSNTNPESEMSRKKKYKHVLDNILHSGGLRTKRTVSVSEGQASCAEDLISSITPRRSDPRETYTPSIEFGNTTPTYANEDGSLPLAATAKRKKLRNIHAKAKLISESKRNSFSSPDLSKINFLDTFDEERVAELLLRRESGDTNSESSMEIIDLQNASLDESAIIPEISGETPNVQTAAMDANPTPAQAFVALMQKRNQLRLSGNKVGRKEILNVSQQISNKFNYSACNTSSINLAGADTANTTESDAKEPKQSIVIDDLTGYCLMAPIIKKEKTETPVVNPQQDVLQSQKPRLISTSTESTSSGYSTGACSSYASSTTSNEEQRQLVMQSKTGTESVYENIPLAPKNECTKTPNSCEQEQAPLTDHEPVEIYHNISEINGIPNEFTQHLYENLLTVKAAQELERVAFISDTGPSTSTPTDSPLLQTDLAGALSTPTANGDQTPTIEEESFYQTPRKSIISVDEKIPSYYPNSVEAVKIRRRSRSPSNMSNESSSKTPLLTAQTTQTAQGEKPTTMGSSTLRRLMSSRKVRSMGPKEKLYMSSSPQSITEQAGGSVSSSPRTPPTIYHNKKSSSSNKPSPSTLSSGSASSATAQRIADNIYSVTHRLNKKSQASSTSSKPHKRNATKSKDKTTSSSTNPSPVVNDDASGNLKSDLLQLEILKSIDFKFEDMSSLVTNTDTSPVTHFQSIIRPKDIIEEQQHQKQRTRATTLHVMTPKRILDKKPSCDDGEEFNQDENIMPENDGSLDAQVQSAETSGAAMSKSTNCNAGGIMGSIQTNNSNLMDGVKKFASLPRFRKFDLSPLKMRINNVLQRNNPQP